MKKTKPKNIDFSSEDRIKININGKDWWVTKEQKEKLLKNKQTL